MATLLEKLKQGLGQVNAAPAPGDETAQITKLAAAKAGVAGPITGLSAPALTEFAAQQETQESLGQLAQQAEAQKTATTQAFQEQEQKTTEALSDIEAQKRSNSLQARIKTENILQQLEQRGAQLDQDEKKAKLEQATALLRLQTRQYTDQLELQGARDRLSDAIKFNEALANDIMQENLALAKMRIKNEEARDVSDREFEKMLASMGASDALAAYRQSLRFEQNQGAISGAATIAQSALSTYGSSQQGQYDQGYQNYVANLGPNERPVSYTRWQKDQAEQAPGFRGPTRTQAGK